MGGSSTPHTLPVKVRIKNASELDFDRVRVFFPDRGGAVDYGVVRKGAMSNFHGVARAYRYAQIKVKAGGREFALQPIDYMGERELAAGRYTYMLGIEDGQLTLDLEKEE